MSITSVRFTEEIDSGLERAVATARRSKSWLINEAVRDYLLRMGQEQERWRETLAAVDQVKRGEVVDGAEVLKWLAAWGSEAAAKKMPKRTPAAQTRPQVSQRPARHRPAR